jgi:hypothetical protein
VEIGRIPGVLKFWQDGSMAGGIACLILLTWSIFCVFYFYPAVPCHSEEVSKMIIIMDGQARIKEIKAVQSKLIKEGFTVHVSKGVARTIIGVIGDRTRAFRLSIDVMPEVEKVIPILNPFKLASREFKQDSTIIKVGGQVIGGKDVHLMAGPCAVESRTQLQSSRYRYFRCTEKGHMNPPQLPGSFSRKCGIQVRCKRKDNTDHSFRFQ